MLKEKDYWVPSQKYQFVEWFSKYYPNVPLSKWQNMKKTRLLAIYFAIRNKRG